jgi:CRISPR-associated endonuclease Csn1
LLRRFSQDYLDEFDMGNPNKYPELNDKLKSEIAILQFFYQRKLKSQKHLISNCEFENKHKSYS